MIPHDFWYQIFFTIFLFWGNLRNPEKFFFQIFFSKSCRARISQYFLTALVLNKRYLNFAHMFGADHDNFCSGGSVGSRIQKFWRLGHFFVIFGHPRFKICSVCTIQSTRSNNSAIVMKSFGPGRFPIFVMNFCPAIVITRL